MPTPHLLFVTGRLAEHPLRRILSEIAENSGFVPEVVVVGISVAANKIPGIRAGVCHDIYSAHQGVEHDDMNVLCLGARIVGEEVAVELVRAFINAQFTQEERHLRRLNKVLQIERDAMAGTLFR